MSALTTQVGGTLTAELRGGIAALGQIARHGTVGGATVLSFLAGFDRLACQLAVAEETLDRLTDEAREIALAERDDHRARIGAVLQARASGKLLIFDEWRPLVAHPCALPFHDTRGGAA